MRSDDGDDEKEEEEDEKVELESELELEGESGDEGDAAAGDGGDNVDGDDDVEGSFRAFDDGASGVVGDAGSRPPLRPKASEAPPTTRPPCPSLAIFEIASASSLLDA